MAGARYTVIVLFLSIIGMSFYVASSTDHRNMVHRTVRPNVPTYKATLLAYGDVNLGRTLGQQLLQKGPGCVFERMPAGGADIVFVNLESTLSEQHGETESPASNFIFTGPPVGARALAEAGITLAATANNHAYDYGERGLMETIDCLDAANIAHVGTSKYVADVFEPVCVEKNGIRFVLFAVTDFMNLGWHWSRHAASTDTAVLFPKLREAAQTADAVIVSVHGGDEYGEAPSARIGRLMRACIAQGAKLVLGHHPHVPYGIDSVRGGYIVQSLGNFVFYQPQREWTQMSYGVLFEFTRSSNGVAVALKRIIPIDTGFQPAPVERPDRRAMIMARAQKYSTISLKQFH
jgi:poly-gamma-glutamate capsule biosynthesis protein CapA/YwtB (metallophosphatase superfamily)